jgi:ketosteroid isomerase-like protein
VSTPKDTLRAWLEAIGARDMDACAELLDEHVVVRVPLAPEGVPPRIEGRAQFEPLLRAIHTGFASYQWTNLELYGTDDPEVAIATSGSTVELADGREYLNEYVVYARVRDGRIIEYREYFDPVRATAALAPTAASN